MYRLTSKLIIYSNIGEDSILYRLAGICRRFDEGGEKPEILSQEILHEIHRLLDLATMYGFNKNLWHNYLAFLLAMTETPFTLVSEKTGAGEGSVNQFVKSDLQIFKDLFDYDFSRLESGLGLNCFTVIQHFRALAKKENIYNKNVSEKVQELSEAIEKTADVEEMFRVVTDFYARYGVGKFGLNKAFRIGTEQEQDQRTEFLIPITNTANVTLDDLIGCEWQKEALIENTEAFIEGREANNVLLYGDAGTGKSTSIKAILNMYYARGLLIIYMDDLSFEESELEYKYLKAIIEGGLEPKPENVLIYATSNRRHLVRESFQDKSSLDSDDIHHSDTVQEKLSLANRFGIAIGFFRPGPKEYMNIVYALAARHPEIRIDDKELEVLAKRWEIEHGGYSGRAAQQFIDYLAGKAKGEGR